MNFTTASVATTDSSKQDFTKKNMGNKTITNRKTITATVMRNSRFDFHPKATQKKEMASNGNTKAPNT